MAAPSLVDFSQMTRRPAVPATLVFPALIFLLAASLAPAHAQGTRQWTQSSAAAFEAGTPHDTAIGSQGELQAGPEVRSLSTIGATYVWAVAADVQGNAYLATGSPATVVRVAPDGTQTKLFTSKDLSVQAIRVGPDGAVYAATLPSGKVYRLDAKQADQDEAKATVVFDPAATDAKPKYIWDLAFDHAGALYVATGAPGAVYKVETKQAAVRAAAKPSLFFESDEPHIRAILFDAQGDLIAGSDGSGLIYRVTPQGKSFILFEAGKREITALALGSEGQLYASAVGEKGHLSLPPLPVQGGTAVTATITVVQPGSVRAFNGNAVLPDGSEIYELPAAGAGKPGAPRKLWSGHDDIVYALHATSDGLLAATGNRGRIYRIAEDGSFADIAHLEASQAVGFADSANGLFVATANTGKIYQLSHSPASHASYESDVFDTAGTSLWGRAEVMTTSSATGLTLYARTGNVESPLRGWTEWKKVEPNAGTLGLEPARFVQWKVELAPGAHVDSVAINYLPANTAPVIDDVAVAPGTRATASSTQPQGPQPTVINFSSVQSAANTFDLAAATAPLAAVRDKDAVTARWAAHDDNGDELTFALYYRGESEATWRLLKDKLTGDRFYTFDASLLPDGAYRMKVVASDSASHAPGEALSAERESDTFLIDTTTPVVSELHASTIANALHVTATVTDRNTPIAHAEYSVDAGPWQYVEPAGRLSDSLVEHYDFSAPLPDEAKLQGEHVVTLRVYDRYENVTTGKAAASPSASSSSGKAR